VNDMNAVKLVHKPIIDSIDNPLWKYILVANIATIRRRQFSDE
jgi:hypothetical protein